MNSVVVSSPMILDQTYKETQAFLDSINAESTSVCEIDFEGETPANALLICQTLSPTTVPSAHLSVLPSISLSNVPS